MKKLFELFNYNKKILYNEKFIKLFVFDTDGDNLSIKKDDIYNLDQIFYMPEKYILPNSLTHLTFGRYYNQVIEKDVLPNSLKHLVLPICYKHDITNLLIDIKIEYI